MKNERREPEHQLTEEKLDEISARFEYTSSAMRSIRKHLYGVPKRKALILGTSDTYDTYSNFLPQQLSVKTNIF
jgi:hypothetical protein